MVKAVQALARPPHAGRRFANSRVSIEAVAPAARFSMRVAKEDTAKLTKPLGVKLPLVAKTSVTKNERSALWLGPDEWLVIDENPAVALKLERNLAKLDCSVVDISHRNTAILISGSGAEDLLSAGCPQDISLRSFPVGACSRTVFGKIEIILWRLDEFTFRMEVWRSFSEYAWDFLVDAARSI